MGTLELSYEDVAYPEPADDNLTSNFVVFFSSQMSSFVMHKKNLKLSHRSNYVHINFNAYRSNAYSGAILSDPSLLL